MHGSKDNFAAGSNDYPGKSVSGKADIPDSTDTNGNDWFVRIAKGLYQKDAGFAIHLATGFDERSCYRYAAGDSRAPGYLIYIALRSDHGLQWLNAVMDGSPAAWWADLQRDRQDAADLHGLLRRLAARTAVERS